VQQLEEIPQQREWRVIHGPTGSGKSRLLSALKAAGAQVLDLEQLAAHRGSVLGNLPGRPQPSQKMFESRLLHALGSLNRSSPVFVEGESKKIGQLQVPEALMDRMRASRCVLLQAELQVRVSLLLEEYEHFVADRASLDAQLDCLVALHGRERITEWKGLAARGAWREFVARLLVEHYDPAYRRSSHRNYLQLAGATELPISAADDAAFTRAARALLESIAVATA
jgi:tRNA 2-selenouridine synthase